MSWRRMHGSVNLHMPFLAFGYPETFCKGPTYSFINEYPGNVFN